MDVRQIIQALNDFYSSPGGYSVNRCRPTARSLGYLSIPEFPGESLQLTEGQPRQVNFRVSGITHQAMGIPGEFVDRFLL
jgi:hypothetical protein